MQIYNIGDVVVTNRGFNNWPQGTMAKIVSVGKYPNTFDIDVDGDVRCYATYHFDLHYSKMTTTQTQTIMETLKKIPKIIKRLLNKSLKSQYQAGYRNDDLSLTEKGKNALLELLATQNEEALGKEADEDISEIVKANKK